MLGVTSPQYVRDNAVNLTYGGTAYAGFAYGWNNVTTPVGNPLTYISNFENILGYSGYDFIVGDNNGNQINARTGNNTIIDGTGNNIITLIEGSNTLYSTGTHNTVNFATVADAYNSNNGSLAGSSAAATAGVEVFLNNATETTFFNTGTGGDQSAFWGGTIYDAFQARTGAFGQYAYNLVQSGVVSQINGGNYASGVTNLASNSTFTFDHVYSGASIIHGHGGNSIFFDNMGAGAEAFYGGTGSNIYYVTPAQLSTVSIFSGTAGLDILRVPGWGNSTASGNAFGATNPLSSAGKFVSIDVIDVRSGLDTVNSTSMTINAGANSPTNVVHPTFNLSSADIQNVTGVASSPTLTLKLDNGELFQPTGTVDDRGWWAWRQPFRRTASNGFFGASVVNGIPTRKATARPDCA